MPNVDWSTLRDAYGPAGDIPALLARARTGKPPGQHTDEPWFTLWSALCHQGDVFTASYAAVPELVAIGKGADAGLAAESLFLAASIELQRHAPGAPAIPVELRAEYDRAVSEARPLAQSLAHRAADPDGKLEVAALVFGGDLDAARAILEEEDDDDDDE